MGKIMTTKPSLIWSLALPVSVLILVSAYYIKVPAARHFIDAHTSLAREYLGRFVSEPEVREIAAKRAKPAEFSVSPVLHQASPTPVETPAKPKPPAVFDLQELARDRSQWPKKVTLKKPSNFPAVLNGKVVGSLTAPVGAEANLVAIKDGRIALEFQGGAAWFAVDDTDLAARVLAR